MNGSKKKSNVQPLRGEIYLVDFEPTVGAEVKKIRPALVIQNDIANKYSQLVIVSAITTKIDEKLYPTEVFLKKGEGGLHEDSVVVLSQIRSIDKSRLKKRFGNLETNTMLRVDEAICLSLGLQ